MFSEGSSCGSGAGTAEQKPLGTEVRVAMKAYVLIETDPGMSRDVAAQAQKIGGVTSASVVTGLHDVIALVEPADAKALGDLLITRLQKVEGIVSTDTDVVIDRAIRRMDILRKQKVKAAHASLKGARMRYARPWRSGGQSGIAQLSEG